MEVSVGGESRLQLPVAVFSQDGIAIAIAKESVSVSVVCRARQVK